MALDESVVRFFEQSMSSRWWTSKSKLTLDPYHAAVLSVCLNSLNNCKRQRNHPFINSMMHYNLDMVMRF